jgi:anti-anti-sigma factor
LSFQPRTHREVEYPDSRAATIFAAGPGRPPSLVHNRIIGVDLMAADPQVHTLSATVITSSTVEPADPFAPVAAPVGRLSLGTEWLNAHAVRIIVAGEVDASNFSEFADYVFRRAANSRRLVLDLRGVEFFGTAGVNVVSMVNARCERAGVEWTLLANPTVTKVLRMCELRFKEPVGAA